MILVFKTGERLDLNLDEDDPVSIMKATGSVCIETKDNEKVWINADDVLYIRDGGKQ